MNTPDQFIEELKNWLSRIITDTVQNKEMFSESDKLYEFGKIQMAQWVISKIEQFQEAQEEAKADNDLKLEPCSYCGEIPEVFRGTVWAEVRCVNKKCEFQPNAWDGSESTSEDIDYKRLAIDRWNSQHY
jgi:hypothetical protein